MLYLFWGAYAQSFFASASCFYLKLCHFLVVHLYLKVDAHTLVEGRCFSSDCLKVI